MNIKTRKLAEGDIIGEFVDSYQALLDHVGLEEDWVVCPIDDRTTYLWYASDSTVKYAENNDQYNSEDSDFYQDQIYTQRYYPKHVYEGEKYTLVFCDSGVDGMKWWRIFSNELRQKDYYKTDDYEK